MKADRLNEVLIFPQRLENAKIQLKIEKGDFAEEKIDWLGFTLSQSYLKLLSSDVEFITDQLMPKRLKRFALLGVVKQMNEPVPNITNLYSFVPALLNRNNEWKWKLEQNKVFELSEENR